MKVWFSFLVEDKNRHIFKSVFHRSHKLMSFSSFFKNKFHFDSVNHFASFLGCYTQKNKHTYNKMKNKKIDFLIEWLSIVQYKPHLAVLDMNSTMSPGHFLFFRENILYTYTVYWAAARGNSHRDICGPTISKTKDLRLDDIISRLTI
jgi:hypothetical protein